jgi:hypothetical protein
MEIRSVRQGHRAGELPLTDSSAHFITFDVQTFEDFDNARLDDGPAEHWTVMIAFNLDDRPDFDRMLLVDAEPDASGGHTLYGVMTRGPQRFDDEEAGPWLPMRHVAGYVRVSRPSPDSVRVQFPESTLKRGGVDRFAWQVRTVWRDDDTCTGCVSYGFDFAPEDGMHTGHS